MLGERKTRPLDAVLDCLGAEQAEARRELKEQTGAAYVSLAPPELTTRCRSAARLMFWHRDGNYGAAASRTAVEQAVQ